jgi:hypothetical protein
MQQHRVEQSRLGREKPPALTNRDDKEKNQSRRDDGAQRRQQALSPESARCLARAGKLTHFQFPMIR